MEEPNECLEYLAPAMRAGLCRPSTREDKGKNTEDDQRPSLPGPTNHGRSWMIHSKEPEDKQARP
jgi:hypothetical protein